MPVRLPRDLSGHDLAVLLRQFGYVVTRQSGSHMRLTTQTKGEHHVTIPAHGSLRLGTLTAILDEVARHQGLHRDGIAAALWP